MKLLTICLISLLSLLTTAIPLSPLKGDSPVCPWNDMKSCDEMTVLMCNKTFVRTSPLHDGFSCAWDNATGLCVKKAPCTTKPTQCTDRYAKLGLCMDIPNWRCSWYWTHRSYDDFRGVPCEVRTDDSGFTRCMAGLHTCTNPARCHGTFVKSCDDYTAPEYDCNNYYTEVDGIKVNCFGAVGNFGPVCYPMRVCEE